MMQCWVADPKSRPTFTAIYHVLDTLNESVEDALLEDVSSFGIDKEDEEYSGEEEDKESRYQ